MNKKLVLRVCAVIALLGIFMGVKMVASNFAEKRVNETIAEVSDFVKIEYQRVDVDLVRFDFHLSDVLISLVGTEEKVKVAKIVIKKLDHQSDIPTFLDVAVKGIEIRQLKKNSMTIRELGYDDDLLLNFHFNYRYDKQKKELNVKKISVGADGAGQLEIQFRLGDIDLNTRNIIAILFAYPRILIHDVKVVYKDSSLVERLMKFGARKENQDVKEYKNDLLQKIKEEIEKEKNDFNKTALIAIKNFIEDPRKLSISAAPESPQPLKGIIDVDKPKDLIQLLNIRIEVES